MKMKPIQFGTCLAIMLAGGGLARAQSHIPDPTEYDRFSQFIASRNIFDPNRYPHATGTYVHHTPHPPSVRSPAFSFVGAMTYDKGTFAFFDGSSSDYRKALQTSGKIAGFTVENIALGGVTLVSDGRTNVLQVGQEMRQGSDGNWVLAGESSGYAGSPGEAGTGSAADSGGGPAATGGPPASSGSVSDVLKRLMQLRQQENK